jgi:hypothetical protein
MSARPAFLVCDADATFQLLFTSQTKLLTILRDQYSVQPIVVPEVEIELRTQPKWAARVASSLQKTIKNGLMTVLNQAVLERHYGGGEPGSLAAKTAMAQIESRGKTYENRVGRGEAYSHALSIELSVPVLSHDRTALDSLINAVLPVPKTVLRFYDLLAFGFQVGAVTAGDIDNAKSALAAEREFIPAVFRNCSFETGLASFDVRLIDGAKPRVGSQHRSNLPFAAPIVL